VEFCSRYANDTRAVLCPNKFPMIVIFPLLLDRPMTSNIHGQASTSSQESGIQSLLQIHLLRKPSTTL